MKYQLLLIFILPLMMLSGCRKKDIEETQPPGSELPVSADGLISWSPDFPDGEGEMTITFDASKGNAGLKGYTGDVYLYAGVLTDKSANAADWKYVKSGSFNTPDVASKMTSLGAGKYSIKISPRKFFAVPASEQIKSVAMVFRNGEGSLSARNKDGSDIYLPITAAGQLALRFSSPEFEPTYVPAPATAIMQVGSTVQVSAVTSKKATLTLTLNGETIASVTNAGSINGSVVAGKPGVNVVKVVASDGSATLERSFSFTVNADVKIEALPAGAKDGVTILNGGRSAIFSIYAPQKSFMYLIGDFNNWSPSTEAFMKKTPDGNRWWIQLDNLDPSQEYAYQYWVDGSLKVADPYAQKVLDPQYDSFISASTYPGLRTYPSGKTNGIVSVLKTGEAAYSWTSKAFVRPETKDLVIYELHMRDFIALHDYKTLEDTLNYLTRLGVNALELMPVNEFEGNSSWGYNPSFYFAPDKYYGTKNALKELIDRCHAKGIAVILDLVLNHAFGQSPMVQLYFDAVAGKPAANSPWFNVEPTHPYNVGYDFNHESAATKSFSKNVMRFWMQEYKIDGFRFDLSKGFTQKNSGTTDVNSWSAYDASRVAIWKDYYAFMKSIDPNVYVILEHFAADEEEKELADAGMMLWNNLSYNFNEATMGYIQNSDLSRAFYDRHGFSKPANLVSYMESHDEERLMYKNLQYGNGAGSYSIKSKATALKRQQLAAAFLFASPGPKMVWQFGELGYDVSIDQNGRTGEKPLHWEYFQDTERRSLFDTYSKLIHWKKNNEVFNAGSFSYSLSGAIKHIIMKGASNNLVLVGNFDVVSKEVTLAFPVAGTWIDNFSGQQLSVSGNYSATYAPGEFHLFSSKALE